MAATIHTLFPNAVVEPAANAPSPMAAVLVELRDRCVPMLESIARLMLDKAGETLTAMGDASTIEAERRQFIDALRVLRLDRAPFTRGLSEALLSGFDPGSAGPVSSDTAEIEVPTFDVSEEAEERVASSCLARRLTTMYQPQLSELDKRVQQMRLRGLQVPARLLTPGRLADAFSLATRQLKTEFQIKLIVYKLFERSLARDLGKVYEQAFGVLDRHGCGLPPPVAIVKPMPVNAARPWEALAPVEDPFACLAAPKPQPLSAARSLSDTLHALAASGNAADWQATTTQMTAANRLFDEALANPALAPALRGAFEPLRMPLVRSALADPTLVSRRDHAVRRLLGELINLAGQNSGGDFAPARFRSLLDTALSTHVDRPEQGVATALAALLGRLRELARERRAALLARIRREVTQDLELRLIGRELSAPVMTLLRSGVGPLMAMRMIKGGRDSAGFKAADALLDRLLASFDRLGQADAEERMTRDALKDELTHSLVEIGMSEPRIEPLIDGLAASWAELDGHLPDSVLAPLTELELPNPAPSMIRPPLPADINDDDEDKTPAMLSEPELLRRLLAPESWFRILDPTSRQSRWLKLSSYYAAEDRVTLSGFDESMRQSLHASRLIDDLIAGRSELINPGAAARNALESLRRLRQIPGG